MKRLFELYSLRDIAHGRHELSRSQICLIIPLLVLVEPSFDCTDLVDIDLRAVHRVWELATEDVRDARISCYVDLPATEPEADRLLDILGSPHVHLPVVLARLVPPTLRD